MEKRRNLPVYPDTLRMDEVLPGDIILFKPLLNTNFIEVVEKDAIVLFHSAQSTQSQIGHERSLHAAICVYNIDGPYIAHMVASGLVICKIGDENYPDYAINRPFDIYRPNNREAANILAASVLDAPKVQTNYSYKYSNLVKTWGEKRLDQDRIIKKNKKVLPAEMICSEFVVRAMKLAWTTEENQKIENFPYPNIRSVISPKALEDYLVRDPRFTKLVYLGPQYSYKQFYDLVINLIEKEKSKFDVSPIIKEVNIIKGNNQLNDLEKIIFAYDAIIDNLIKIFPRKIATIVDFVRDVKSYHGIPSNDRERRILPY